MVFDRVCAKVGERGARVVQRVRGLLEKRKSEPSTFHQHMLFLVLVAAVTMVTIDVRLLILLVLGFRVYRAHQRKD